MKAIVCGSRDWFDREAIRKTLTTLRESTITFEGESIKDSLVIAHGAAHGADQLAGEEAIKLGMKPWVFPADWKRHQKRAGRIRNRLMYDRFKPDFVLAFSDHFETSRGTRHMAAYAISQGTKVTLIEHGIGGLYSRDLTLDDVKDVPIFE